MYLLKSYRAFLKICFSILLHFYRIHRYCALTVLKHMIPYFLVFFNNFQFKNLISNLPFKIILCIFKNIFRHLAGFCWLLYHIQTYFIISLYFLSGFGNSKCLCGIYIFTHFLKWHFSIWKKFLINLLFTVLYERLKQKNINSFV